MVIDYTYSIQIDNDQDGNSGIIIYNNIKGTVCESYYVTLVKEIDISEGQGHHLSSYSLALMYLHGRTGTGITTKQTYKILESINVKINFVETKYYLLSIHVTNGNVFNVYLNDIHHLFYDHSVNNNVLQNGYSGYIGIRTDKYTISNAKSLYRYEMGNEMDRSLDIDIATLVHR